MFQRNRMPAERERAIFLIGFMGCGKSTVGPVLASLLGRKFIDLDRNMEIQAGCTIGELIARDGEECFRRLETEALRTVACSDAVIAPGGGAFTRDENRELMAQSGLTVWLDAPFDLCWRRIREDSTIRPLAPDEVTARDRHEARLLLYSQTDLRIPIDETMPPEVIAEAIIHKLHH